MAVRVSRAIPVPVGSNGTHESRNVLFENRDIKLMRRRRRRIGEGKGWARVEGGRTEGEGAVLEYRTAVACPSKALRTNTRALVP
jgi:hypothetical protein